MNYSKVENLIWTDPNQNYFDCDVSFDEPISTVRFTCNRNDPAPHSQDIWSKALNGEFGIIAPYPTPNEPSVVAAVGYALPSTIL